MNRFIRYRLLTIVLLGVLTSAVSVFSLVQLLTTSTAQRIERVHDAIGDEIDRLARAPSLSDPTPTTIVAMRAGIWSHDQTPAGLPTAFVEPARAVVRDARAQNKRVMMEIAAADGTMVIGARPVADPAANHLPPDAVVFAAYIVKPLPSLRAWQRIVALLGLFTVLLVATAVYSVVAANRGATALRASLDALASDLRAPVPRPSLRELDAIAEGIEELARKLADARVKEEQLARELAQKGRLAALGRVAAGVAHEVRNPLASIKLRLDLAAASSAPLPESVANAITHATSEIERLDRLVADLLVVAGRAIGPKGNTDLGKLVKARAEALAPWANERGIALKTAGEAMAVVDSDSAARAIDNLLRNAVEASPSGQTVNAIVAQQGSSAIVCIEDTGTGVVATRTNELFEPFFTTKPAGTGLGLAISRAIAQAHGGDVEYDRIDDNTTCFTLSFAARTDQSGPRALDLVKTTTTTTTTSAVKKPNPAAA